MTQFGIGKIIVVVVLGLLGWALCGAVMFIGMSVTSLATTLILHAIGAPIFFWGDLLALLQQAALFVTHRNCCRVFTVSQRCE